MDAIIKKLTRDDIQAVDSDGLNGQHLVEYGYYKITLVDRPEIYCYAREFGGLKPEEILPYLVIEHSDIIGDYLRIDLAAVYNDETRHPVKVIPVKFVEAVPGENTRIFKNIDGDKYYMRMSCYPRENFARWLTAYKSHGRWEDGATIRANIIFNLNGETEKVTATNWNGSAVYSDHFNSKFEQ